MKATFRPGSVGMGPLSGACGARPHAAQRGMTRSAMSREVTTACARRAAPPFRPMGTLLGRRPAVPEYPGLLPFLPLALRKRSQRPGGTAYASDKVGQVRVRAVAARREGCPL